MRALVVTGPRQLEVASVPDPTPRPDQLVLRVAACGICGSDLHLYQAGLLPAGSVMGHEFCGEVVESAHRLRAGERVCALPVHSCGRCERCGSGMGMYCEKQVAIGFGQAPGAFAEFVAVAPHEIVRLPAGVEDAHGALIEPLAVGLHAVNLGRIRRGESCLIVGAGPIGLAICLWARHFGASEVIVSERAAGRRALAERLGATCVVDPAREDLAATLARLAPGGPDVVFEAVGAPGLIAECVGHARFRGRVVVAGVCISPDSFVPSVAVLKEVNLQFVLAYERDDFQYSVDMLEQGRIAPQAMLTDRVSLDAAPAAFDALEHPDGQCKVLVVPGA